MLFHVNSHTVLGFVELNSAKRLLDNIYRWDGYCSRLGFLSKQASGIVFAHNFKIQNLSHPDDKTKLHSKQDTLTMPPSCEASSSEIKNKVDMRLLHV